MRMKKDMTNVEIAHLLEAVAAAYELQGKNENRFKIIAYERAADAVQHLSSEAKDLWDDGKLQSVSGIGPSISQHLGEIFDKGESRHFKELMADIPSSVFEMIEVSGIGAKTAFRLAKELKISDKNTLEDLMKKAEAGKIAEMEGFGEDSEKAIINGIKELEGREKRMLLSYAKETSELILDWMKKDKNLVDVQVLGSLRRKASTIGDIDIAAATKDSKKTLQHFTEYPNTNRVLEIGEATAGVIIPGNIQIDLMVQEPDSYGALLQHFTGSKHHNIALREYARKLSPSLSLSEYGIKVLGKNKPKNSKFSTKNYNSKRKLYEFAKEEDFYQALKMNWIPPELREDRGEIQAAINDQLPDLIEIDDVKGDLQIHSNFDIETSHDLGSSSMEDIALKADKIGYEYVALTEHNPSQSGHNDKQIVDILKNKKEAVQKLNEKINKSKNKFKNLKKVFNSLEIDILPDGKLPVPEKGLETLDFALVSIHSSFRQDKNKMTKRILNGMNHPKVKIWAHPTGRRINEREGVDVEWEKIFEFFKNNHKLMEINADPMRLDLPDVLVKDAVTKGMKLTLGTDSHHTDHMDNMIYAVFVARRGWAERENIVCTYNLSKIKKVLELEQ